jgi:hypothetical protein
VQVVHGEQQRCPHRQVRSQPVQRVNGDEYRIGAGCAGRRQHLPGRCRRPGEQLPPDRRRRGRDRRLEKLADYPESELTLQFGAAGPQHLQSPRAGILGRRGQQPGFPRSRGALDDHQPPRAGTDVRHGLTKLPKLRPALKYRWLHGRQYPHNSS